MKKFGMLLVAIAVVCSAAETPERKLSSDLKVHAGRSLEVIIQWNASAGSATADKISALGGTVVSEFEAVHSGVYKIPASALDVLKADGDVKFISVDRKVRKKAASVGVTPASINAQYAWNAGYTGVGFGVAIIDSGINQDDDLGLNNHGPVYTEDFTVTVPAGKPKPASYGLDWYGHGQHLAGIIASNGKSSTCASCTQSFVGIAPGANLINLKVLDANGEGADSYVLAAINRAINLKTSLNIRVINLSLGRPVSESYTVDPLCQAVEAAWKAGIVVVVSAGNDGRDNSFGNDGYATINSPGNDPYVITVGAMKSMNTASRADDLIASYSSKGPTSIDHIVKPDILAPGNQVVSLLGQHTSLPLEFPSNLVPLSLYQSNAPKPGVIPIQPAYNDPTVQPPSVKFPPGYSNQYFILSGTSMAAAVVSGAVADLLQANPSLTPDQVKLLLMSTASKTFPSISTVVDDTTGQVFNSYYDLFTVGAGYLDLKAALAAVRSVPSGLTSISPTAVYDASTSNVALQYDPTSVFSDKAMWGANTTSADKAMWGASSVWGTSVLVGNSAVWGTSSVWGQSSNLDANTSVWGTSAVWGNKALWGASNMTNSESTMAQGEQ